MRTVTDDGWPYRYRAHIVPSSWFGKPRWRFRIERHWVHWTHLTTSRRYKTREEAEAAANRWLDRHDRDLREKEFV